MFFASKVLSFLTQPIAWAILLLLAGLLLTARKRKLGLALCWSALVVLALIGWQGPVDLALRQLETRYPALDINADLKPYVGVVVLGGALDSSSVWEAAPGRIGLNNQAERMIVPVALARRFPHLKIVFTGGEGELRFAKYTEADRARIFFEQLGVPPERGLYESESRTTYDNAWMTARLPGVDPRQPWLVLTTAAHMPRSMAAFKKAGWNATAYPVDFRAGTSPDWDGYRILNGVEKWHYVLHETLGYAMYWATGRL